MFSVTEQPINFYGDPLQDFSLSFFLERFVFKNPKKTESKSQLNVLQKNRNYKSFGSRGQPVHQLTESNCTEDERFIFEFLNKKRERKANLEIQSESKDIDDDEFDAYLDSLGPKKKKKSGDDDGLEDDECDFLADYKETSEGKKSKKSKNVDEDEEENDFDDDEMEPDDDENDDDEGG